MEQDKDTLQTWLVEYIDRVREKCSNLHGYPSILNHFPHINFESPCQFDIFWLQYPEAQLVIKCNDIQRPDKQVSVHGPYLATDFIKKVAEDLEKLNWNGEKVTVSKKDLADLGVDDIDEACLPNVDLSLADVVSIRINEMINSAISHLFSLSASNANINERLSFERMDLEQSPRSWEDYGRPHFCILLSNLCKMDCDQSAESVYLETKSCAEYAEKFLKMNSMPDNRESCPEDDSDDSIVGHEARFFPTITTEKISYPHFADYLTGNLNQSQISMFSKYYEEWKPLVKERSVQEKTHLVSIEEKVMGQHVKVSSNGSVFVDCDDPYKSRKILNLIMAVSTLNDLEARSLSNRDISAVLKSGYRLNLSLEFEIVSKTKFSFKYRYKSEDVGFGHEDYGKIRVVSPDLIREILKKADIVSKDARLTNDFLFWIDSETLFLEHRWTESFIFGWVIVERRIKTRWRSLFRTDSDRRCFKDEPTFKNMINQLLQSEKSGIDRQDLEIISKLYRSRNDLLHEGKEITLKESERCKSVTSRIILNEYDRLENV